MNDMRKIFIVACFMLVLHGYVSALEVATNIALIGENEDETKPESKYPKGAPCKIYDLKILDCGVDVSRLGNKRMRATFKKDCNLREQYFLFNFESVGSYSLSVKKNEPVVTVDEMKNELRAKGLKFVAGSHFISVEMFASSMRLQKMHLLTGKCSFRIITENPWPTLGNTNKNVREDHPFTVDASKSVNNDLELENVGLMYRWNCKDTVGYCEGRNLGTENIIVVNKTFAKHGAKFKFVVEVKTSISEWKNATQHINVDSSRPFSINCMGRCGKHPNIWNPSAGVTLFAFCEFDCHKYDPYKVDGSVLYLRKNRKPSTLAKFALSPKVLKSIPPASRIEVVAYYDKKRNHLVGEQHFASYPLPKLTNCKSIPPNGSPLTKFRVTCTYEKANVENFEILVRVEKTVVFSQTGPILDEIEFNVPSKAVVIVVLRDRNDVKIKRQIPVKVEPLVAEKKIDKALEKLLDVLNGKVEGSMNVEKLILDGLTDDAFKIINIVNSEWSDVTVENEKDSKISSRFTRKLLQLISQLPVNHMDQLKSLSGLLSVIANKKKDNFPDSIMAKELSELCSKMAKAQINFAENQNEELIDPKDHRLVVNNLLSCGEKEIVPFYSIFNESGFQIEITTHHPIQHDLSENDIEDYPEYFADDVIEEQANNFRTAAENVMSICRDLGYSLIAATPADDELPTFLDTPGISIVVVKGMGNKLAGVNIPQRNFSVRISKSLKDLGETLAVQICSYRNNPFWSTVSFKINTNVIEMTLLNVVPNEEMRNFGIDPMIISLRVSNYQDVLISGNISLPSISLSTQPEDNFTITKIQAKTREDFFIEFVGIGESDLIEMVLTDMERPRLANFSDTYSVTKNNSRLLINNAAEYDKFFLMVVIPKKIVGNRTNLGYTVYSVRCVEWDFNSSSWKVSCTVQQSTTPELIKCECSHLSTIAGSFRYNDVMDQPRFIDIYFVITRTGSLFIPVIMSITVGFYFFLLVYTIQKRETKEDAVYFLSDVPVQYRYSYLISIRTGKKVDAGTTSVVMIQIFGTDGKSKEHVLNFPDPFLELLQSNQTDLFVLATGTYLGKLLKINLWFDCTGNSPNWYCSEIRICDMQTKVWFSFHVHKWLRIDGKSKLSLEVLASSELNEDISKTRKIKHLFDSINLKSFRNTIWSPWAEAYNPSFGLLKRLTLLLSILLSLMGITMSVYGIPELMERDSITPNLHYSVNLDTVYIGLFSAAVAFLPHFVLMQGFKHSRLQFDDGRSGVNKKMPFCTSLFIWIILCTNVICQIHFLMIYGYWVIFPITWQWATSVLVAVIFYIFVLENTFQIILTTVDSLADVNQLDYEKVTRNVEQQRKYLYFNFGESIFRPILTPFYRTLGYRDYVKKHLQFLQKREVVWQLQDLAVIVSFISLLYFIILDEKQPTYDVLVYGETVELLKGHENNLNNLERVNTIKDFEDYMESSLIPNLQSYEWYGRYLSRSPGLTTDGNNRYLGIIRIRQHRVEDTVCDRIEQMDFINRTCTTVNYIPYLSFLNFTPGWVEAIPEYYRTRLGYVWGYNMTTGESYFGVSGYYKKGGYIALLGRTKKNSIVNFEYLRRYYWMDSLTRIIFIELPIYNVNLNLLNFVTVILEKTPAGYIHKRALVTSSRINRDISHASLMSLICIAVLFGLIGLITVRTTNRIIKTKVWYKKDYWQIVDVLIVSISFTWIYLYFRRVSLLKQFVKDIEENSSNNFIEYFEMVTVESSIELFASLLICVMTIRMWRLLRFANVFRVAERTLAYSFESLMYCFAFFFICCIGFGIMGYTFFCNSSEHFNNGISTTKTLILMTIGLRGPNTLHIHDNNTNQGYTYIVLFYMYTYFFTTIIIAILLVNFVRAQQFAFEEKLDYNVKDYSHEGVKNLKRLTRMWVRKFRLKAGGPNDQYQEMVTPKDKEIRYMNCESVNSNRMRAMVSVARCVLRRRKKRLLMNEADHVLMMKTVLDLCNHQEGEEEFFFKQDTKSGGCIFVDDQRILKIEEIVKKLVETPEQKAARKKKTEENEALRAENLALLEMLNYRLKVMLKAVNDIEVTLYEKNGNKIC